jgi:hypothetical protein
MPTKTKWMSADQRHAVLWFCLEQFLNVTALPSSVTLLWCIWNEQLKYCSWFFNPVCHLGLTFVISHLYSHQAVQSDAVHIAVHMAILFWCRQLSTWDTLCHRYCRTTAITVIKLQAGPNLGLSPTRLCSGTYTFFLHINDLPKIINNTSVPIIFGDVTSILFAHSNLIDFNKNFHIDFVPLNKWFRANQLFLHFNKTNCVHFTTNRNMLVN